MNEPLERPLDRILGARWWLFAFAVGTALAAFQPAQHVTYNRSIENMFASDDPVVEPYRRLKRVFGGNELVLAVYVDDELLHPDGRGMRRLAAIRERLEAVSGVREVLSLDRPLGELIVEPDNAIAQRMRSTMAGYTHGEDGRTVAAVCMLAPATTDSGGHAATITALRQIMQSLPDGLAPGLLAGEPVLVEEGFASLELDGQRLARWSTALVGLTILICFRSPRWVIIPLAIVQWTLLATAALLAVTGLRLSLVSSMWSSIITVVGIATTVHLLVQYRDLRHEGFASRTALARAAALVAMPIVWSLVTDAFGFGSLLCSRVGPVRDFGLMTAVGSLLVLVSLVTLTPLMALWGSWDSRPTSAWGEGGLNRALEVSLRWVTGRPRLVGVTTLAIAVVALAGVGRLEVETDFTRNFRPGSPLVQSYEYIESHLGGAGVLDVLLPAPATLEWPYLQRVLRLEERLRREVEVELEPGRREPALTKVLSAADVLVAASPTDLASVPVDALRQVMLTTAWALMRDRSPVFSAALFGTDPEHPERAWYRILIRAKERQPATEKMRLIAAVERIVHEEFRSNDLGSSDVEGAAHTAAMTRSAEPAVTGYFVLLSNMITSTVSDQWTSFGLASIGVALVLFVAFRKPMWVVLALIPNALPIVLVLGVLGWLDLKINLGVAMIAAVSMGLSVDSSIHYLTAFQRRLRNGATVDEALAGVQQSVGRAMVFSTLALIVGFTVLSTSEFVPTVYFGWLVSLAMLGGLAGNLLILPFLLRLSTS